MAITRSQVINTDPGGDSVKTGIIALDADMTTAYAEINTKIGLNSPAFTGVPTAPTAPDGTATTQLATTAFVASTALSSSLPGQTGNEGKFLTTNGSTASFGNLGDTTTYIENTADTTKKAKFSISGLNTGTTITLSLPTATDTLVGRTSTDTLTNKTLTSPTINSPSITTPSITNPTITNYVETLYAPAAGSSFTIDLANGTLQKLTTNANTTITLPTSVAGKSYTLIVAFGGTHTLTWAGGSTIKWATGTEPTETSVNGKIDVFSFLCDGTNTYGCSGGANY